MKPTVSAIIVNWNGAHHLRTCLPSLLEQSHPPAEILVADNGSVDESESVVRSFGGRYLPLGRNLGIAVASNHAARQAQGDFLLFLNNDMRFDREFVRTLVDGLTADPLIFAVDGVQYDWDGREQVHLATRLGKGGPRGLYAFELLPGLFLYQEATAVPVPTSVASGANMLARRSEFHALGGFDERFFAGYEDVDLSWRASLHGWKTLFLPDAICWHRVGGSSTSREAFRARFRGTMMGRLVLAAKLLPLRYLLATWMTTTAGLAVDAGTGRVDVLRERAALLGRFAGGFSRLVWERRELFRAARTTPGAHLRRLLGAAQ